MIAPSASRPIVTSSSDATRGLFRRMVDPPDPSGCRCRENYHVLCVESKRPRRCWASTPRARLVECSVERPAILLEGEAPASFFRREEKGIHAAVGCPAFRLAGVLHREEVDLVVTVPKRVADQPDVPAGRRADAGLLLDLALG